MGTGERSAWSFLWLVLGCSGDIQVSADAGSGSSSGSGGSSSGSAAAATTGSPADGGGSSSGGETMGPPIFDVAGVATEGESTGGAPPPVCKVDDDMDAPGPCVDVAPPGSFEPEVQWAWLGGVGESDVIGTPAVANLTDDNGDGEIDLCDVPDVVVVAYAEAFGPAPGHVYILDGETGAVNLRIATGVEPIMYPALGDLDGDAVPEIVVATPAAPGPGHLIALRADGTTLWEAAEDTPTASFAPSIADLDADGSPEIMFAGGIYGATGARLWTTGSVDGYLMTAADLDDDGLLEVVHAGSAFHADGSVMWSGFDTHAHPHVANLDADPAPEVLLVAQGLTIVDDDGSAIVQGVVADKANWRPAAIHDMDGDGAPEIAVGAANSYSVLELDLSAKWTAAIGDESGFAAGTAFDFLGDGTAEAMYADETNLFIFDELGGALLTTPRTSWTQWENPVVVDVDNDGSAEIVVVSNGDSPPVQVIRDVDDRWIPARRIWNMHDYHVTNVREDGTIPAVQPRNWESLNTFRTQAQIAAGGGVCMPVPAG